MVITVSPNATSRQHGRNAQPVVLEENDNDCGKQNWTENRAGDSGKCKKSAV